MVRDFAGGLGLGNRIQEVSPLRISEQLLRFLYPRFCAVGDDLKNFRDSSKRGSVAPDLKPTSLIARSARVCSPEQLFASSVNLQNFELIDLVRDVDRIGEPLGIWVGLGRDDLDLEARLDQAIVEWPVGVR